MYHQIAIKEDVFGYYQCDLCGVRSFKEMWRFRCDSTVGTYLSINGNAHICARCISNISAAGEELVDRLAKASIAKDVDEYIDSQD